MLVNILVFIASLIPSILIVVFMTKRKKGDLLYAKTCNKAVVGGLISVLPILAVSGTFYILGNVMHKLVFPGIPPLLYAGIYNFVVLAFAEEIVKYGTFRIVLTKDKAPSTYADIVAYMIIIGTLFGLLEDIPYAIGANAMTMAIRGLTMGHVGYALIMGWFHAKSLETGKKGYSALGLIITWIIHGIYDFSLSNEFMEVHEALMLVGISFAILDVVLLILMIVFFVRVHKKGFYQQILVNIPENVDVVNDENGTSDANEIATEEVVEEQKEEEKTEE